MEVPVGAGQSQQQGGGVQKRSMGKGAEGRGSAKVKEGFMYTLDRAVGLLQHPQAVCAPLGEESVVPTCAAVANQRRPVLLALLPRALGGVEA